MDYPTFVAMVNQTNVPPGAYMTLNAWALHGRVDAASCVLEVACTTGFSSRELARATGCSAFGFDRSADAVALAQYNYRRIDPALRLDYVQADGLTFSTSQTFSHIVVGAALGFFPDPQAMARRLVGFLEDGGYVLAAPFWCDEPLSAEAAAVRRDVFGITGPMETYDDVMEMFQGLDVFHEAHHIPRPESPAAIERSCVATVDRICAQARIRAPKVRNAMVERLYLVKNSTNFLRRYQRYTVLVLRYDRTSYPNRYVELF